MFFLMCMLVISLSFSPNPVKIISSRELLPVGRWYSELSMVMRTSQYVMVSVASGVCSLKTVRGDVFGE